MKTTGCALAGATIYLRVARDMSGARVKPVGEVQGDHAAQPSTLTGFEER
jgi:hypothetical protein